MKSKGRESIAVLKDVTESHIVKVVKQELPPLSRRSHFQSSSRRANRTCCQDTVSLVQSGKRFSYDAVSFHITVEMDSEKVHQVDKGALMKETYLVTSVSVGPPCTAK